jgi:hypothetical protein
MFSLTGLDASSAMTFALLKLSTATSLLSESGHWTCSVESKLSGARPLMLLKTSKSSRIKNMPHALPVIVVRRVDHESYVVGHDSCATQQLYDHEMTLVAVFFLFSFLLLLMQQAV